MIPIKDKCDYKYIYIYIYIYIRLIYLMPWKFVCDLWVSWNFYKTAIIRQTTRRNESKIEKYSQKPLGLCRNLYVCLWVCVYVWVRVCICVFVLAIVAYYCVSMDKWCIVHVYLKVHTRCFNLMLSVHVSDFATVLSGKIFFIYFCMCRWLWLRKKKIIIACWGR